ncbi:MAG: DNA-binding protein HU-beta [bacterium]|nr:MAG: DNA-binding protein HU-beta [bacterium]
MNKKSLIELVKKDTQLTEQESAKVVTQILESITSTLSSGEKVDLRGFGAFSVHKRAARKGRNLNTGEIIEIPARKAVSFRASKTLKQKIRLSQNLDSKTKS